MSELAVDARQVALSKEQRLAVLERSGELIGVAGQVGFFAGETILRSVALVSKLLLETGRRAESRRVPKQIDLRKPFQARCLRRSCEKVLDWGRL